jgi:hypothetical protein
MYKFSKNLEAISGARELALSKLHTGKAVPLQAWTGPEGPRRLRIPDFKTIDS